MNRAQSITLLIIVAVGVFSLSTVLILGINHNTPKPTSTISASQRIVGVTVKTISPITITLTSSPITATITLSATSVIAITSAPSATSTSTSTKIILTPTTVTQASTQLPTVAPSRVLQQPTQTRQPSATKPPFTATAIPPKFNMGAPAIPGPSPTWSVLSFPTRAPAFGPTKLGFHATLNGDVVLDYVAKVKPPLMKAVDDIKFLKKVKEVSPNTITIGRYVAPQLNIGEGDPVKRAIEYVNEWLPRYREHSAYVDYWEGWNEVSNPNREWYATFEATRACEMQKYGLKAAIGGFSAGTPEPWQFEAFLPAIEAGLRCNSILTLHEYGAPTMYLWWSQGLPAGSGKPAVPAYPDRGPLIARYRYFYRDYLIPRNMVIKLAITETGVDGLVGLGQRPGYSTNEGAGWKGFSAYWSKELNRPDSAAFYVEQLAWYDSLLRQDEYVIGATIFNVSGGTNAEFTSYEPDKELITKLTEYALKLR